MFHKILVILIALSPLSAFAEFKSNDWNDEMTDTKTIERYTRASKDRFGFRCDIDAKSKDFMLTFASDDSIATPNSTVEVKVRIDKGKVHNLNGKLYSNSYKSGLIRTFPTELIYEIKNGSELLIHIYSYRELEVQRKFSLKGSSKALGETAGACDVLSGYSAEVMDKVKKLEKERDKEIAKIQAKYTKKISDLKNGSKQ